MAGRPGAATIVTLEAWPDGASLAALPDGASVTPQVVATTRPNGNGDYALDPDLAALGPGYVENAGTVNLDVTVTDPTVGAAAESLSFTAARPGTAAVRDNPLVATPARPQTARFDLRASTVATALGAGPLHTTATANSPTPPPRSGKSYICGSTDAGPVSAPYAGDDRFPGPSTGGCGSHCTIAVGAVRGR